MKVSPALQDANEERTGWVKVQNACLAVGRPHSERLSAANVRTRLRELLRSTVQTLASQPAPMVASSDAEAAPPRDDTVFVFVGSTARIQDKQPKSKRGRHYHSHQACHRSGLRIDLKTAQRFGHSRCSKCHSRGLH